jgi:hypothetical protein
MKRRLLIVLIALPAFLVAGAWTKLEVSPAHAAAGHSTLAVLLSYVSTLFLKGIDLASQITEEAYFLGLGACFIVLALVLHRKSTKPREQ